MKKAQTEIIGLMVIVILFIFVGLIYVMFAGRGEQAPLTREVTQAAKVQNMLDAFVQVTPCFTEMPYKQMSEIISECCVDRECDKIICGEDCQELITTTLDEMMGAYVQYQEYEFRIQDSDKEFLSHFSSEECTGDTKAATDRVLAGSQVLTLKLVYCEQ